MMQLPLNVRANILNLRRLVWGAEEVRSSAYDEEILCPEEQSEITPTIFLPGQLEKITGTPIESTVDLERHLATRNRVNHAPTIAYHIRNAILLDGSFYAGTWKYSLYQGQASLSPTREDSHFEAAALASTWVGTKYFGHWLRDDCLQYMLAEAFGYPLSARQSPLSSHMTEYAEYFCQDWTSTSRARIDHLVIFQDFSQNSHKKRRYAALQRRLASRFAVGPAPSFVYLKRGQTGQPRIVYNEDEIIATLSDAGFSVIDIASDSLQRIVGSLMYAKLVVSIEGSHLCHCWFPPGNRSGIIALQPPDRFTAVHRGWAHCMSARFGFLVGEKRDRATYFSVSQILRTVDLMLAQS